MRLVEDRKIYSISEANFFAKQTLEQMVMWIEGEVSTCRKNPNWNFYYLDLKDDKAVLPCIAEDYMLQDLGENPVGQKIIAFGNLSLYEPFGKYQFKISRVEKAGDGHLQRQLEELIRKLKAEGLFDISHKKEIPKYPKRICLVTSEGSDAWNDFRSHTTGVFPIIELFTADVRVQGPKSVPSLLKVLPKVDSQKFDIIVITRGGGSLEDLAAFNDEQVARCIFAMKTPTIVAIGHEANESLAEWVADKRASTPTDAAHIVISSYQQVLEFLEGFKYKLKSNSNYYFSKNFQTLDHYYLRLQHAQNTFKDLPHRLSSIKESLKRHEKYLISDALEKTGQKFYELKRSTQSFLKNYTNILGSLQKSLVLLSPKNTLKRGYSITTDINNRVIRSVEGVAVGSTIGIKLSNGRLKSKVTGKQKYD
ncbi:exodeoxyribonuclease VII large subunit [Candidatus Curtissbacteria bacterium RIFCSPHIGHO2_01_FULL_41_11]|uniref:Exodeoxyribonuclease 7 large subunit n=1 Tax=Candidatus Curtissbacteria bacterium RIFCSPHIGHO2_01_FULL_41_11 TaxID=1797711 RepID=A0A1F5G849_9BACT|nr:MAG: exodeoxyribonuclease VII large subunit [Candidatus Curtissbacteria bacterium RIFCSPHIGHO2_01_FULL_41_11]